MPQKNPKITSKEASGSSPISWNVMIVALELIDLVGWLCRTSTIPCGVNIVSHLVDRDLLIDSAISYPIRPPPYLTKGAGFLFLASTGGYNPEGPCVASLT